MKNEFTAIIEKDDDWKQQEDKINAYAKHLTKPKEIHLP